VDKDPPETQAQKRGGAEKSVHCFFGKALPQSLEEVNETRIGQMVTTLVNADIEASYHRVQFDGSNLASGVYYYKLQAGSDADEKKLLLIR
jgi:hypothetical protein